MDRSGPVGFEGRGRRVGLRPKLLPRGRLERLAQEHRAPLERRFMGASAFEQFRLPAYVA